MRYPLLVLFALLGMSLMAQDDCLYEVNEIDAFTKERKTITKPERISVQVDGNVHFRGCYVNEDYFLRVELVLNEPYIAPKGNQVWLMMSGDNIMKVNYMTEGAAMKPEGKTSSYESTIDLDVTEDQWEILKSNKITRMRFMLKDGHYDFKVKADDAEELQHLMRCAESAETE